MIEIDLDIMLTITANGCTVGPRLERGTPMPRFQRTYKNTPEGMKQAQKDLEAIKCYVIENQKVTKRK